MKLTKISNLILLGLALTFTVVGCKKHPTRMTNLPNGQTKPNPYGSRGTLENPPPSSPIPDFGNSLNSSNLNGIPFDPNAPNHNGWIADPAALASETGYFE